MPALFSFFYSSHLFLYSVPPTHVTIFATTPNPQPSRLRNHTQPSHLRQPVTCQIRQSRSNMAMSTLPSCAHHYQLPSSVPSYHNASAHTFSYHHDIGQP